MLEVGMPCPLISLPNTQREIVNFGDLIGKKKLVIYFYPKDDTPSCTIQANDFTSLQAKFGNAGSLVFGISKDNSESHQEFSKKFGLSVSLLSDLEGDACQSFDTWGEKEKNGIRKMGIIRSTFVVGISGSLEYVEYGVKAQGHAAEILTFVEFLR